jgi:hypothetical protein
MKKLLFLLALCGAAQSYAQNVPVYVPTNGLVGWWPFSGNALDSSGNGNNGTVNGATLSTDRFGNNNSAFLFDGIDDFIQTSNVILLNSLTISVWVNPFLKSAGNNSFNYSASLVDMNNDASNNSGYSLCYNDSTGIGLYSQVGWSGNPDNTVIPPIAQHLNLFQWQNCVFTFSNNTAKIFFNGILVYTKSNVNSNNQNPQPFLFGKAPWGINANLFKGKLDDIGIWDRALNNSEISALYNYTPSVISNTSIDNQTTYAFYPNPTNSFVNVNNFSIGMHLKAYSIYGQLLTESDTNQIDISNLSNGNYFVLLFDEENQFIKSEMIYKK